MSRTVADLLITALTEHGVGQVWGVVGDALNPVTDAIRRTEGIEWIGVRHEEAGAFAASAQSQLSDDLAVCMGTVGPGAIHLLNGLYDARKSHTPVLAICGQVPRAEMGQDYFQEVDNDRLFADVAVFCETIVDAEQAPRLIERAVNAAISERGVAVLTLPGDVGSLEVARSTPAPRFVAPSPVPAPDPAAILSAARAIDEAERVTLLVGMGARHARDEVLELAERLQAPIVLTLKAKEGLEHDNAYQIGQSGLIGNPATALAFAGCDALVMIGTDFPYTEFLPAAGTVVQLDMRGSHIGRRTSVTHPVVGDARAGCRALTEAVSAKDDSRHLDHAREAYQVWSKGQLHFTDPGYERKPAGLLRRLVDDPDRRIRPELLAATVDRHAATDAIFTTDTGMSTVWLSRFVSMGVGRRLIGSYNLGSMANAMPQALGAQALDRGRQVISFSGDGGLSMLLGDLLTAVAHDLPIKVVVFDNGRLGMVKLEMEQVGLPEFGTVLHNPDFAAVASAMGLWGRRVTQPDEVDAAVAELLAAPGPGLLDVVTNPDEIAVPPKPSLSQLSGFAIAKAKEIVASAE